MPHEDPFWRESKNLNLSSNVNIIHQGEAGRKAHEESRRMTKDYLNHGSVLMLQIDGF